MVSSKCSSIEGDGRLTQSESMKKTKSSWFRTEVNADFKYVQMEYEWQEYPLGSPVSALCLSSKVNDNDDKKKTDVRHCVLCRRGALCILNMVGVCSFFLDLHVPHARQGSAVVGVLRRRVCWVCKHCQVGWDAEDLKNGTNDMKAQTQRETIHQENESKVSNTILVALAMPVVLNYPNTRHGEQGTI